MKTKSKVPLRQCTGCREMKEKKDLLRILRTDTGEVILDITGRRNGRGAYVCRNAECLKKAQKSRAIERALGMVIPDPVIDAVLKELKELE